LDNPVVVMTTYNRRELLNRTMASYLNGIGPRPEKLYIFDDRSSEMAAVWPGVVYTVRNVHLGCDENNLQAISDAFSILGAENVLVLDSDCQFSPDWYGRAQEICQTMDMTRNIVSLFNAESSTPERGLIPLSLVGGLGMIINKEVFKLYRKVTGCWDNDLCTAASQAGVKIYSVSPSLLQHTGHRNGRLVVARTFQGEKTKVQGEKSVTQGEGGGRMLSMCSSRRPDKVLDMIESWDKTVQSPNAALCIYVWEQDPRIAEFKFDGLPPRVKVTRGPMRAMVEVLNYFSTELYPDADYYHEINDDHFCVTPGWDKMLTDAIDKKNAGYSIAYGKTKNMPTSVMFGGKLVRALDYMFPREFRHSYVDDWLCKFAQSANLFAYVPTVEIEHRHPMFGLGAKDEVHKGVEADYEFGKVAFARVLATMPKTIDRIREIIRAECPAGNTFFSKEEESLLASLPPGFGPDHPDWNRPGRAAWRNIWIGIHEKDGAPPMIHPAPIAKVEGCPKCSACKIMGFKFCGHCGRKLQ